jgi:hypothetical protein
MIEAKDLTKRYGDTLAVRDLSFEVHPEVVTGSWAPTGREIDHDAAHHGSGRQRPRAVHAPQNRCHAGLSQPQPSTFSPWTGLAPCARTRSCSWSSAASSSSSETPDQAGPPYR